MANTKGLASRPDQELIRMFKEFSGPDKERVIHELYRRHNTGTLMCNVPRNLLDTWKRKT